MSEFRLILLDHITFIKSKCCISACTMKHHSICLENIAELAQSLIKNKINMWIKRSPRATVGLQSPEQLFALCVKVSDCKFVKFVKLWGCLF